MDHAGFASEGNFIWASAGRWLLRDNPCKSRGNSKSRGSQFWRSQNRALPPRHETELVEPWKSLRQFGARRRRQDLPERQGDDAKEGVRKVGCHGRGTSAGRRPPGEWSRRYTRWVASVTPPFQERKGSNETGCGLVHPKQRQGTVNLSTPMRILPLSMLLQLPRHIVAPCLVCFDLATKRNLLRVSISQPRAQPPTTALRIIHTSLPQTSRAGFNAELMALPSRPVAAHQEPLFAAQSHESTRRQHPLACPNLAGSWRWSVRSSWTLAARKPSAVKGLGRSSFLALH